MSAASAGGRRARSGPTASGAGRTRGTARARRARALVRPGVLAGAVVLLAGCNGPGLTLLGPRDDEDAWAIRAASISGPERAQAAEAWADALRQVKGLRRDQVRVIDDGQSAVVYYGRYRRRYDASTGRTTFQPDHRPDLELIRGLTDASGRRPFAMAMPEVLPLAPEHPEWDLSRQTEGRWSLHVAVFYNEGEMTSRRRAAEQYCAELRRQGHAAFFHHGPVKSSVCVGLFPEGALQTKDRFDPRTGRSEVVTEIVDPGLIELQKKFPHNLENGRVISQLVRDPSGQVVERIPNPSFVVRVPAPAGAFSPAAP